MEGPGKLTVTAAGSSPASDPVLRGLQEPCARLCRAQDDRPAAEDARGDRPLQRAGIGSQRHPGRDVCGHHPVLCDRHQQEVEEEALLLGGLAAGEQEGK